MKLRAAVFASGRGSNFQVLAAHAQKSDLWKVVLLVTDRPGAQVLDRAQELGIDARVVPVSSDPDDSSVDMLAALEASHIDLVLLAGYLRLVPEPVVRRYRGRMLNIHPALLPSFGGRGMYGMRVHEAVLSAGVRLTGVTVHFVDEEYDRGPILAQWPVPVIPGDTPEAVAERIHAVEYQLYPAAADRLAMGILQGRTPAPIPCQGDDFDLDAHLAGLT